MNTKELAKDYLELKQLEKGIQKKIKKSGELLIKMMKRSKVTEITDNKSKVSIITKVNIKYPDSVNEKIKKLKEYAEKKGKTHFSMTEYLRVNIGD